MGGHGGGGGGVEYKHGVCWQTYSKTRPIVHWLLGYTTQSCIRNDTTIHAQKEIHQQHTLRRGSRCFTSKYAMYGVVTTHLSAKGSCSWKPCCQLQTDGLMLGPYTNCCQSGNRKHKIAVQQTMRQWQCAKAPNAVRHCKDHAGRSGC